MMYAPIVIFAFNRPDCLKRMVDSLKQNVLYEESEKYVYVDGARSEDDVRSVEEVIEIAYGITSNVIVSKDNKGLGESIITGVSAVIHQYGCAIVLEDDLRLMPGFLTYLNQALTAYRDDNRIISICGYGLKIDKPKDYVGDVYLSDRSSSWGWGTWADRWDSVDWQVKDFEQLKADKKKRRIFNQGGSDLYGMLRDYMEGRNHSWAIRFCYSQFRQGKFSIHPFLSFVENDGFGEKATNCKQKYSRFKALPNKSRHIYLPPHLEKRNDILCQLHRYHSIPLRIYSKLRSITNL